MTCYADEYFYREEYLLGRDAVIPTDALLYWFMCASHEIDRRTFGRIEKLETIPVEVRMCCCDIAEKLYKFESAKGENGMILQSYGNDGETATYKTTDMSERALRKRIADSVLNWLLPTGLLYCGVN